MASEAYTNWKQFMLIVNMTARELEK